MTNFKINLSGVEKAVSNAIDESIQQLDKVFSRLSRELKGQPIENIKSRLQHEMRRNGGSISDPELTQYATAIFEGTEIKFEKKRT